jgi:hypothetical protein
VATSHLSLWNMRLHNVLAPTKKKTEPKKIDIGMRAWSEHGGKAWEETGVQWLKERVTHGNKAPERVEHSKRHNSALPKQKRGD